MLDDLRDSTGQSPFFKEETPEQPQPKPKPEKRPVPRDFPPGFLGMTAAQRFVLALMLFLMIAAASAFCLIAAEKVMLPFF